jgi:ligand-binding sensor domain-containing protein
MNKRIWPHLTMILVIMCVSITSCASATPTAAPNPTPVPPIDTPTLDPFEQPGWIGYTGAKHVSDMAIDAEGDVWAVSEMGVFEMDVHENSFKEYTIDDGLLTNQSGAVGTSADGDIWIAGKREGIARFDGTDWTYYTTEDGMGDNTPMAILGDPDGGLWVGFLENIGGVSYFDGETWVSYSYKDGMTSGPVMDLVLTSEGVL